MTQLYYYRLIKLASSKMNYLIGIGAIILYLNCVFFVVPTTDPDVMTGLCNITPWLTAIGYSLCYGTIFMKMVRVYYIFSNPSTNKKVHNRTVASTLEAVCVVIIAQGRIKGEGYKGQSPPPPPL